MIPALVSRTRGVAIASIGESLLEIGGRRGEEVNVVDEATATLRLQECSDLESVESPDIAAIQAHVALRAEQDEIFHATLIAIDASRSAKIRQAAVRRLEAHAASDQWPWIEAILASAPFPSDVDISWAATWQHPLGRILPTLDHLQDRVHLVSTAWRALPAELFAHESPTSALARLVNRGAIRLLYSKENHDRTGPFRAALGRFVDAIGASVTDGLSAVSAWGLAPRPFRQQVAHIWDATPWRVAWFGSRWETTRSRLACDGATRWGVALGGESVAVVADAELAALYDTWRHVRHDTAYARCLEFATTLSGGTRTPLSQLEHRPYMAQPSESTATGKLTLHAARLLGPAASANQETLLHLTGAFFGVDEPIPRYSATHLEKAAGAREDWSLFAGAQLSAHGLQFDLDSNVPLSCLAHDHNDQPWADLAAQFRSMLEVYTLNLAFSEGGAIALQVSAEEGRDSGDEMQFALINLERRRRARFSGRQAIILAALRTRLVLDLQADLPVQRCGWIAIRDLASRTQTNTKTVRRTISQIWSEVSSTDLSSETVQLVSGRVRFNPEAVAAAAHPEDVAAALLPPDTTSTPSSRPRPPAASESES